MKYLIFIAVFFPNLIFAQIDVKKSFKKMGLDEENVVRSNENILLFPRMFVYNKSEPDSAAYFGCISTDKNSFKSYFEGDGENVFKLSVGETIIRQVGECSDSIEVFSLNDLKNKLTIKDSKTISIIDSTKQFVVVYFWNSDVIDRDMIKNYKYFKKYSAKHPDLKIQILAVLNE